MPSPADSQTFAIPLADGCSVEAVFYPTGTLCISTQVGCAVGCPFCASGARGLYRNLTCDELWLQVDAAHARGWRPGRVTLSGIGEPLHNSVAVEAFMDEARERGVPISVTTTGRPAARLRRLLSRPHNGVMISLHAGRDATYSRLVPGGASLDTLWQALAEAWPELSRSRRRKVGINILLLRGINDDPAEMTALAQRLRPYPEITVHLLVPNPVPGSPFESPAETTVAALWRLLRDRGIHVRRANTWRRRSRGGCGTLVTRLPEAAIAAAQPR